MYFFLKWNDGDRRNQYDENFLFHRDNFTDNNFIITDKRNRESVRDDNITHKRMGHLRKFSEMKYKICKNENNG